jgi:hypothetical protein
MREQLIGVCQWPKAGTPQWAGYAVAGLARAGRACLRWLRRALGRRPQTPHEPRQMPQRAEGAPIRRPHLPSQAGKVASPESGQPGVW